jgi:hypothetical protein
VNDNGQLVAGDWDTVSNDLCIFLSLAKKLQTRLESGQSVYDYSDIAREEKKKEDQLYAGIPWQKAQDQANKALLKLCRKVEVQDDQWG